MSKIGRYLVNVFIFAMLTLLGVTTVHGQGTEPRFVGLGPTMDSLFATVRRLGFADDLQIQGYLVSRSFSQIKEEAPDLIQLGSLRLRGEDQIRRVHLYGTLLKQASDSLCGRLLEGTATEEDQEAFSGGLDSLGHTQWAMLALRAWSSEIKGTPAAMSRDEEALRKATDLIDSTFSDVERYYVNAIHDGSIPFTPIESCKFLRFLYGRVLSLPNDQQEGYARSVTVLGAQKALVWVFMPAKMRALVQNLVDKSDSVFLAADLNDPVTQIYAASPRYPPALQALRVTGSVDLQYIVDTTGHVEPNSFKVLGATHQDFVEPAETAIRQSVYKPARYHGRLVRQLAQQRISFRIRGQDPP